MKEQPDRISICQGFQQDLINEIRRPRSVPGECTQALLFFDPCLSNRQLAMSNRQSSIVNCQLSIANYQLVTVFRSSDHTTTGTPAPAKVFDNSLFFPANIEARS